MIENKLVTIKKENTFEYGWALFVPWHDFLRRNKNYKAIGVSEIVKQITFSKAVTLMLSEPCLPRKVIDELKWVAPYAEISLIAKTKDVIAFYKELPFSSTKINPLLSLNYIGIAGKSGKAGYFISEGFLRTDDSVEKLFVSPSGSEFDFTPFADVDKLFVLGDGAPYLSPLFQYCESKRISAFLVKTIADFNKSDYDAYRNRAITLLVAEYVGTGICAQKGENLFRVSCMNGKFVFTETADFDSCLPGNMYCNLKKKATLQGDEIPQGAYVLYDGTVQPLLLKDSHVVKKIVQMERMEDFIAEHFDQSETESHNRFSAIAKSVEYQFVLAPPSLPKESTFSDLYQKAQGLLSQWKNCYSLPVSSIRNAIADLRGNQDFLAMLQHIEDSNSAVCKIIGEYHYQNYPFVFRSHKSVLMQDKNALIDYCCALNASIFTEINNTQTCGLDDEIAGYEKTIREKQACIDQNIDVLQSKRRIEILQHKIEELNKIKERIVTIQTANTANGREAFIARCKKLLIGDSLAANEDSVSSIVHGKEKSQQELLNDFLQMWLQPVNDLLCKLIYLLGCITIFIQFVGRTK